MLRILAAVLKVIFSDPEQPEASPGSTQSVIVTVYVPFPLLTTELTNVDVLSQAKLLV